jgi:hypothetical protein
MLVDPLPVKSLSLVAHTAITVPYTDSMAVTDVAPGKSVRIGALQGLGSILGTLTIAHSVSNENKPVKTDRCLVRFDVPLYAASGQICTGSAYFVVATPRGCFDDAALASAYAPLALVQALLGVIGVSPTAATLSDTNLLRILAGEP